jgi:hypothetical protein
MCFRCSTSDQNRLLSGIPEASKVRLHLFIVQARSPLAGDIQGRIIIVL